MKNRYMEAVQGKELDRIFSEEGFMDDEEKQVAKRIENTEKRLNVKIPDVREG